MSDSAPRAAARPPAPTLPATRRGGRPRLLVVGCGDIGLRVAALLRERWRLVALTSDASRRDALRAAGVVPLVGDLDRPATLRRLAGLAPRVLHLAPPAPRGAEDRRTANLLRALARGGPGAPRRIVYVGTTGVYGDAGGAFVDESRPVRPATDRARRRVDAERRLRAAGRPARRTAGAGGGPGSGTGTGTAACIRKSARVGLGPGPGAAMRLPGAGGNAASALRGRAGGPCAAPRPCPPRVTLLRAPGIYALDRAGGDPRERLRRGTPVLAAAEDVHTNHVHADDLARACVAALHHGPAQRALHVSDDGDLKTGDHYDLVARLAGLPPPPRLTRAEAATRLSPMQLSFLGESRRLGNARLKRELRLRLRYPTVVQAFAGAAAGPNAAPGAPGAAPTPMVPPAPPVPRAWAASTEPPPA